MVVGIFILGKGFYVCSTKITMDFTQRPYPTVLAENCFGTGLKVFDMVDCILKYTDSPPVKFTGCIRKINGSNTILISVASTLETTGVTQILEEIIRLV